MSARIKNGFKTWMLVYVFFVVALTAANLGGEPPAATVSPGSYPTEVTADEVFFTPTIQRPRRSDI